MFRTKRRVHVATSSIRVIEEDIIPDPLINGALYHLLGNRSTLSQSIQQEILEGDYRAFEDFYQFAENRRKYPIGLPNARYLNSTDGSPEAVKAIEQEVGGPVEIEYLYYAPLNNLHMGWKYITEELGYNHTTNELTILSIEKGAPVYLDVITPQTLDPLGEGVDESATSVFGDSSNRGGTPSRLANQGNEALQGIVYSQPWSVTTTGEEGFTIKYSWQPNTGQSISFVETEERFVSLESYDNSSEYYHARFRYSDGGIRRIAYWTYSPKERRYPKLDGTFALSYTEPGKYFPFVIIRENGVDLSKPNSPTFDANNELLKKLRVNYEDLGKSIHENPDVDDVNFAALMMAVPADSEDNIELAYLFHFFKWVSTVSRLPTTSSSDKLKEELLGKGRVPAHAIEFATGEFRFIVAYENINFQIRSGYLGPVGTVYQAKEILDKNSNLPGRAQSTLSSRVLLRYMRQVSPSQYEMVEVRDLVAVYNVKDNHQSYSTRTAEDVLIPISREISSNLNIADRSVLYNRSLRLVFHAYQVEKIRWYQRTAFLRIVMVVAIVIMAYFGPIGNIFTSIIEGSLLAAGTQLVVLAIQTWAFNEAFAWLAGELGTNAAIILATMAAVAGVSAGLIGSTSTSGFWAENLLTVSNGLFKGISDYSQKMLGRYINEAAEFELMAEEKWAELEEVNQLLEPSILDPFAFIGMTYRSPRGESANAFYNRTIHAGNIGTLCFDYVESFVEISLKLPDIGDTLEGTFYA